MADRAQRGLSLVEVIVLVAVAGVMTSLALPALHAAQIFSRRVQCTNNLKLIGLSCHNYESANGSFPMSRTDTPDPRGGHGVGASCFTALLPYMEQATLYNTYNFDLENWHVANATSARVKISTFLCPDNKGDAQPLKAADVPTLDGKGYPGANLFARNHYGANWGGGHEGTGDEFVEQKGKYLGLILPVVDEEGKKLGVRNVRIADITDGTSFTVLMAEKRAGAGWAVGGFAGSEFDVHTSPAYDGDDPVALMALTGSPHARGVNTLMGDGSVRLLPNAIEKDVWYALMTRAGGEPIEPDKLNP